MRRLAPVLVLAMAVAACATPPIRLTPLYEIGTQRTYDVTAVTTTTVGGPGDARTERTELVATSTVEVIGVDDDGARVRLTVRPVRFERDGAVEERPEQQVELIVAPDGTVVRIEQQGGLPADIAGDAGGLAPYLGVPLPADRLRLGQRWDRDVDGARQRGLVAALRVEHGFDAVILRVGTERSLRRERALGDRTFALDGTEFSTAEIAFAFREGFPVRVTTNAEGRFDVVGALEGGEVTIRARSILDLRR